MLAAVAAGLPCVSGRCCQPRHPRRFEGQQKQQHGEASSLARFSGTSARLGLPRLCARTVRATGKSPLLLRRSALLSTAVAAALLVQVHAMWPFSDRMRKVWAAANELQKREGKNVYTVQVGDTLYGIAGRLGTTVEILKEANELGSDTIYPGQELWTPRVYEIQQGDTLLAIARRFETTLEAILEINQIDDPNVIRAGDVMLLP